MRLAFRLSTIITALSCSRLAVLAVLSLAGEPAAAHSLLEESAANAGVIQLPWRLGSDLARLGLAWRPRAQILRRDPFFELMSKSCCRPNRLF